MAFSLDDLLSTTLEKWARKELANNILDSNALFYLLKERAKGLSGGTYIWEPLMYGKSTAVQSYSGYDALDVSAQQGVGRAEFNWKQYAAAVTLSGEDEAKNSGQSAVIDLLEVKANQAKTSLFDKMNADLFADGTGNGLRDLDGLAIAIDASGTYGGILRSTNPWWAAKETAVGGPLTIAAMRTMFTSASAGGRRGQHPNLLLTTRSVFDAYEGLLQPDQRFQNTKMADGGFANLEFKGQPIVWDEGCTAGTLFFINTEYLSLKFHSDRNFTTRAFITPANQDAKVAQILWMGNLTGSNCRRQGKLTGIS